MSVTENDLIDPTGVWADLVQLLAAGRRPQDVLHDVAALAMRQVPAAEDCSITLVNGTSAYSPAAVSDLARRLDENQFRLGNGPCLDAGTAGEILVINDPDEDDRWPAYLSIATVIGLGSSVSAPLPLQQEVVGALNLYSSRPHAFDETSIARAHRTAGPVAAVVSHVTTTQGVGETAEQLQDSMHVRAVIEQAKGILMAARRCSADTAFEHLRLRAHSRNQTLREAAVALVSEASGQAPESLTLGGSQR